MNRDIFTIKTAWERRAGGIAWMQPTSIFFGEQPRVEEFYPLDDETAGMSDEDVAQVVLQGVMVGVFMLERTLPVRYVPPEEFDRLMKENAP